MQFPCSFTRYKGGGGTALGSDTIPSIPPLSSQDNILFSRITDTNGWPAQRIAVTYLPPSGSYSLTGALYFWEYHTGWIQIGASTPIAAGVATFFDVVSQLPATVAPNGNVLSGGGSLALCLVVTDPGAAPSGAHVFAVAADLTAEGTGTGGNIGTVAQGAGGASPWLVSGKVTTAADYPVQSAFIFGAVGGAVANPTPAFTGAGHFRAMECNCANVAVPSTAPAYLLVMDKATAMATNDVPKWVIPLGYGLGNRDKGVTSIPVTLGLAYGISSTPQKFTAYTPISDFPLVGIGYDTNPVA